MLRIKRLRLKDFRGFRDATFDFGDFACLIGPNGIGKTSILDAVSLLCSSLDFRCEVESVPSFGSGDWKPSITAEARTKAFLKKNIRGVDDVGASSGFRVEGLFEKDGIEHAVVLSETGFERNDLLDKEWWWPGMTYFAKFDAEMHSFIIPEAAWSRFAEAYEGITGIRVEIETQFDPGDGEVVVDKFWLYKPNGRISSKKASAGERKIAKTLSQIVNLPVERMPDIILVDNLEMHIHPKRHLRTFDEVKRIFKNCQIIATTHSTVVVDQYQPREHLIDVEASHNNGDNHG